MSDIANQNELVPQGIVAKPAIKVNMAPCLESAKQNPGGFSTLIQKYHQHLPGHGFEFVTDNTADLQVIHAAPSGIKNLGVPLVSMLHGLIWGDDIAESDSHTNANITNVIRHADEITVPSNWVAQTIRRDMRINPHVIPHGVDWEEWQGGKPSGYILWNKNISNAVCNPATVNHLAKVFPHKLFLTTFAAPHPTPNIKVTGKVPYRVMKEYIKGASVYLSLTKETMGISTLEAMAAGVPILGWANGGNLDTVKHGVNGYLAQPGNYQDLEHGLDYCLQHGKVLGDNGKEMAKAWGWAKAIEKVAGVWRLALEPKPPTVGAVIPVYNKSVESVMRAVYSVRGQTLLPEKVIVIDDGSDKEIGEGVKKFINALRETSIPANKIFEYHRQHNQGVAVARNNGMKLLDTKYAFCLDSDDFIDDTFVQVCVDALEADKTLGVAYTRLTTHEGGKTTIPEWPPKEQDYDRQISYHGRWHQIPTCCVFRRDLWVRCGGQRQRFAPDGGAGSEDAGLFTLLGAMGYRARRVSDEGLFHYSVGHGIVSGNKDYQEKDWLAFYPWARDKRHPFMSIATPLNGIAHAVRDYSEPVLSVIIPLGPGHERDLFMPLDSIEGQSFREWEVVVVNDTGGNIDEILEPYPFVIQVDTPGSKGAGYARNRGVEAAAGQLILFQDADDFINMPMTARGCYNQTLEEMVKVCLERGEAIYTNYVGRFFSGPKQGLSEEMVKNVMNITDKGEVFYKGHVHRYNRERAILEPSAPDSQYVWNLINTMMPKSWHFEIDGFDESMPAWEDWEYFLRLAKAGKCFSMIDGYHFVYRYYSGQRREAINENKLELLGYIKNKHKDIEVKMCNCTNRIKTNNTNLRGNRAAGNGAIKTMTTNDSREERVNARYVSNMSGNHTMRGPVTKTNYGQGRGGTIVQGGVWTADLDIKNRKGHFERIGSPVLAQVQPQATPPPKPVDTHDRVFSVDAMIPKAKVPDKPTPLEFEPLTKLSPDPMRTEDGGTIQTSNNGITWEITNLDLTSINGINEELQQAIFDSGLDTKDKILAANVSELVKVPGIGKAKAEAVVEYLLSLQNDSSHPPLVESE